jgi:hypothetical protein
VNKVIETTEHIDYNTGEIKASTIVRRFRGDEPSYIKVYLGDIAYLHGLPAATSTLLQELLQYVTYGTQEIGLTATFKKRIAMNTGMTMQTLNNKLQDLLKAGIIDRVAVGTFVLNPYLFGKGDWKTINELRNKNIHLEISYDAMTGERKIRGSIDE